MIFSFNCLNANLLFPVDSSSHNSLLITFNWEQKPNAEKYRIQISQNVNFYDVVIDTYEISNAFVNDIYLEWGRSYYWRVQSVFENIHSSWIDTFLFTINDSYVGSTVTEIFDHERYKEEGFVLYNGLNPVYGRGMVAIDKIGNPVWYTRPVYLNNISEFGEIFGIYHNNTTGQHINFNGELIWTHSDLSNPIDNHEFKIFFNGNYLGFDDHYQLGPITLGAWTESFQDLGYLADGETNEFLYRGNIIYEWDKESGEVIWSWNSFDHIPIAEQDIIGESWQKAIINNSFDHTHANSWDFDIENSMLYVSFRQLSRISKIAYPSGEIIWNLGLPSSYNTGDNNICTDLGFSYQHNVQVLDDGSILFFDNGNISHIVNNDSIPTSRVLRILVSEDYSCEKIWEYTLPQDLYGYAQGSVQLLDNGNYLIYTVGGGPNDTEATIIEVSNDKEILWKTAVEGGPGSYGWWYRAYQIDSIFPDAYGVIFDNLKLLNNSNYNDFTFINNDSSNTISFTIYNKSKINQPFVYYFKNSDEFFQSQHDTIMINSGDEQAVHIFQNHLSQSFEDTIFTEIELDIWPLKHHYSKKTIIYWASYLRSGDQMSIVGKNLNANSPTLILKNNHPNPFNPITTLNYDLIEDSFVNITIYDILGNVVKNLIGTNQSSGYKSVTWNSTDNLGQPVSAGLYFYTIQAGNFRQTKKMILIK